MKLEVDVPVNGNPYHYTSPLRQPDLFFGRVGVLEEIDACLGQPLSGPLLLVGEVRSGRSSLLYRLKARQAQAAVPLPVALIDLSQLTADNLSLLVWEMGKTAVSQWTPADTQTPTLDKTGFIAAPLPAFRDQCLTAVLPPVTTKSPEPSLRLLLLADNIDALLPTLAKNNISPALFNQFWEMLLAADVGLIMTCTAAGQTALAEYLPLWQQAHVVTIGPLDKAAALALIRQPTDYTIFQDVADYIYALTQGSAYEIQYLCYQLQQYRQEAELGRLTVADVVYVAGRGSVNGRLSHKQSQWPLYTLPPGTRSAAPPGATNTKGNGRWRVWVVLAAILLIVMVVLAFNLL